jgi:hypothetical protein
LIVLTEIRNLLTPAPPVPTPAVLEMVIQLNGTTVKGNKIAIIIKNNQSVPITLVELQPDPTQAGQTVETPVVGPAVFSSSDPAVATVTADAVDPNVAVVAAVGPNGVATITATADGLTATLEVTVVDSEVASLTIVPGTPTP